MLFASECPSPVLLILIKKKKRSNFIEPLFFHAAWAISSMSKLLEHMYLYITIVEMENSRPITSWLVEGIMLNIPIQKVENLSAEAFSKMKNLGLLKISSEKLLEDFINGNMQLPKGLIKGKVQLPQGLSYLSNKLRLLEWHGYHLKCLPTNFQLNKLVELRMHCSGIKQLWNGNMVRFLVMQMCILFIFIKNWFYLIIFFLVYSII